MLISKGPGCILKIHLHFSVGVRVCFQHHKLSYIVNGKQLQSQQNNQSIIHAACVDCLRVDGLDLHFHRHSQIYLFASGLYLDFSID